MRKQNVAIGVLAVVCCALTGTVVHQAVKLERIEKYVTGKTAIGGRIMGLENSMISVESYINDQISLRGEVNRRMNEITRR